MTQLNRRLTAYTYEHPWRMAAALFMALVLLSALMSTVFHRHLYAGLLAAYGVSLGLATGWSTRRHQTSIPFWRKAVLAPVFLAGWVVLGLALQVTGLLAG